MYSFLKIKNQTDYPAISVEVDDVLLAPQILAGDTSPAYTVPAGSIVMRVRQHTDRPFLSLWLAPKPETENLLIIHNDTAFFV